MGGLNLYNMVHNNPTNLWDFLGMTSGGFRSCGLSSTVNDWDVFDILARLNPAAQFGEWLGAGNEELASPSDDRGLGMVPIVPSISNPTIADPTNPTTVVPNGSGGGDTITKPVEYPQNLPLSPLFYELPQIKPGKAAHKVRIGSTDPKVIAVIEAMLEKLRNLKNPKTGKLTQAALLLRKLEASGLGYLVEIDGKVRQDRHRVPSARGSGIAAAVDGPNGGMSQSNRNLQKGLMSFSQLSFEANPLAGDELGSLAHELVHGIQYATGTATNRHEWIEAEATRVQNEVWEAIGMPWHISDTYGVNFIPAWNRYVPWVGAAPSHNR